MPGRAVAFAAGRGGRLMRGLLSDAWPGARRSPARAVRQRLSVLREWRPAAERAANKVR